MLKIALKWIKKAERDNKLTIVIDDHQIHSIVMGKQLGSNLIITINEADKWPILRTYPKWLSNESFNYLKQKYIRTGLHGKTNNGCVLP